MPAKTKTIIAAQPLRAPMRVTLRHPKTNETAVAEQVGHYTLNGRNIGLILRFPDGTQKSLTYNQIRELQ